MARAGSKGTVTISGDKSLDSLFAQLPALVAATGGPMDRAVTAASKLVEKRAKSLAPDSKKTGTKNKQSKKSKGIWTRQVKTTIRSVVRKYETVAVAIVGPQNPIGNASHFVQEKPRKHVLWGKTTAVARYRIERNWITQAFDETKQEQLAAMESSLRVDIEKAMKSGG